MNFTPFSALTVLPEGLRGDVVGSFNEVVRNYREHRWEPAELNGGKLCEAIYTVILGYMDGRYAERSSKPNNILDACRALEHRSNFPRAIKIQIPRMLIALYEIRNNRGVGHAGGDVDPSRMDATAVLYMSKWLMAELVRFLHDLTTDQASSVVESLIEREVPLIWTEGNKRRVLKVGLSWKKKMLLLLLPENGAVGEAELLEWIEHPNPGRFRRDVLRPAHKQKLIEFNEGDLSVRLLPPGIAEAESLVNSL
ncbi:hypothetical protein [Streptomyces lydicus]|uniref:hypothetical protein n=1 Tax=Streptomyces lydicus TaxID=47763 RepID=UPI0036E6AACB